jgi:hypothetical protein
MFWFLVWHELVFFYPFSFFGSKKRSSSSGNYFWSLCSTKSDSAAALPVEVFALLGEAFVIALDKCAGSRLIHSLHASHSLSLSFSLYLSQNRAQIYHRGHFKVKPRALEPIKLPASQIFDQLWNGPSDERIYSFRLIFICMVRRFLSSYDWFALIWVSLPHFDLAPLVNNWLI